MSQEHHIDLRQTGHAFSCFMLVNTAFNECSDTAFCIVTYLYYT